MNIGGLKYFLVVAELKHFGQAAEQCFDERGQRSNAAKDYPFRYK